MLTLQGKPYVIHSGLHCCCQCIADWCSSCMIILLVNLHLQQESQGALHAWSSCCSIKAHMQQDFQGTVSYTLLATHPSWHVVIARDKMPILHCHMAAVLAWVHVHVVRHLPWCFLHQTGAMRCCRRCISATCMPPHSQPWSSGVSHGTTM